MQNYHFAAHLFSVMELSFPLFSFIQYTNTNGNVVFNSFSLLFIEGSNYAPAVCLFHGCKCFLPVLSCLDTSRHQIQLAFLTYFPIFKQCQARNQKFFKADEFSWISVNVSCTTQKKGPTGKNLGFFLLETLKNSILNEKFNSQLATIWQFFPKNRGTFFQLQKNVRVYLSLLSLQLRV